MDSEQIPEADNIETALNETFLASESSEDEESSSDTEDSPNPDGLILGDSDGSSQELTQQRAERRNAFAASVPAKGCSMQRIFRQFSKAPKLLTQSQVKPITQEEVKMFESISQTIKSKLEAEPAMFERYVLSEDETLPEVRQLTRNGFITAKTVHTLTQQASQSQRAGPSRLFQPKPALFNESIYQKGVLTQAESNARKKFSPTVDVEDSDDDIDHETLMKISQAEDNHILNHSLESLSQVVSNSQKAAKLVEDTVAKTSNTNLDAMCYDLELFSSDDEEYFHTEALEQGFLTTRTQLPGPVERSPPPSPIEVSYTDVEPIAETEDLECNFLMADTQHGGFTQKEPFEKNLQISSGIGNTGMFSGFSLSSGKSSRNAFDVKTTEDFVMDYQENQPVPAFSGFGLASGKAVTIKETFLSRFEKAFLAADRQIEAEVAENTEFMKTPVPVRQFKVPFSSPAMPSTSRNSLNNSSFISTPESSKPSSRFSLKRQFKDDSLASFLPSDSPAPTMGFASASGTKFQIKSNTLSKISEMFAQEDQRFCQELEENATDNITPVKPRVKKLRLDFGDSPAATSPVMRGFQQGINQHSTPFFSRYQAAAKMTDTQEISSINDIMQTYDTEDLSDLPLTQGRKKLTKVRLLNKLNKSDDEEEIGSSSDHDELLVPSHIKIVRNQRLEAQKKSIKDKADCDKSQMAGSVFMMKSSGNRQKVNEFVDSARPRHLCRHQITFASAIDFKFDMKNFLSEEVCRTNVDGVSLGDNAKLFMDEKAKVGVDEVKSAFLASPGTDPSLADERWIENTFKMIVLKLAWLENSFVKFARFELLNPENLLLQMKYRYDREIDRHHRSAVRKIVELDDVPCRRMVLKVLDVLDVPAVGYELVLSDGWHSIKAKIDKSLADAVDRRKIEVGTKLVTSNAEILGCERGFDPLNMPDTARLKIHANSTRRTCWDEKLGFCANPNPIRVPLDSVLVSGGVIGKLVVVVTHVYQVIYVDSSKEPKEFRSEKLQNRLQNKLDVLHFSIYEIVAHQVQQKILQQLKERVVALKAKNSKFEDLSAEDICDLLEYETDAENSSEIQAKISPRMKRKVQTVRDERAHDMKLEIRAELGERDKNLSKILKFRVVDALNPVKTALVSCWLVHDELIDLVKEGRVIEIINSSVGPCTKEIQVTAGKSSIVKSSKAKIAFENFKKFFRHETRIEEINRNFRPPQDEFDVACVIVLVESRNDNKSAKVFVADEDKNILCLNFWSSLSESAFDDVLIESQVVYARNLQWRSSHANDKIPQAFVANEATLFLLHPKNKLQERRLAELNEKVSQSDEFLATCRQKIEKVETINKETNNILNSTLNQTAANHSILPRLFTTKMTPSPVSTSLQRRLGMNYSMFNQNAFSPKAPTKKPMTGLTTLQRLAFGR